MVFIKTYGRTTILASYSEIELLNKKPEELDKAISEILKNAEGIHNKNNLGDFWYDKHRDFRKT